MLQKVLDCSLLEEPSESHIHTYMLPVASVACQVILEPDIGQFRDVRAPPSAYSYSCIFVGTFFFLVHKLTCRKRESVIWQRSMRKRRAVGLLNPMRDKS